MDRKKPELPDIGQSELSEKMQKGKKGVVKLVFGRTAVILLLVALQALFLVFLGLVLWRYVFYVYGFYMAVAVVIVLIIINRPGLPEFKLPWIVMTLVFPIMGGLFYLFVETQLGTRIMNRKVLDQQERTREYIPKNQDVLDEIREQDGMIGSLAGYLQNNGFPTYRNNGLEYYPLGDYWFPAMLEKLREARKFIFLEYFIIEHGKVWDQVLEILKDKVLEGVEVRLMYDGTLQFASLSHDYPRRMEAAGIQCKVFSPIKPALSTYQNNRDHRKILVIDGEVGFTGGTNLADEYVNQKVRFGHWKDTAIMIRGDAVRSLTVMFLQLWDLEGYENNYVDYLDVYPRRPEAQYPGYVIPYTDSPLDQEPVGKLVYIHILQTAKDYVHIMTPYLILDHDMITSLTFAAKRGVDVKIILPHIPDKAYAFALARTHYSELLRAGVKIYEYLPGFVHAKTFVSDDTTAVVGTINLDYRSLYLHFENAVLLYGAGVVADMEKDFEETLKLSVEMTEQFTRKQSLRMKAGGWILKLFAPLM